MINLDFLIVDTKIHRERGKILEVNSQKRCAPAFVDLESEIKTLIALLKRDIAQKCNFGTFQHYIYIRKMLLNKCMVLKNIFLNKKAKYVETAMKKNKKLAPLMSIKVSFERTEVKRIKK